ncbi:MAG: hypothetical protein E7413_01580 [Ruminococcaceae bacterium]|nr:hypothetical protein [Oscillospiraceae bacterium]
MDSLETNVILKFQRLCDCWLCEDCGCENSIVDSVCLVCGANRTGDDLVLHAGEEGPVNTDRVDRGTGGGRISGGTGGGRISGGTGGRTDGGLSGRTGGGYSGGPVGSYDGSYTDTGSGSNIGLIVAIIFIVIAVIAVSVGILLYQ